MPTETVAPTKNSSSDDASRLDQLLARAGARDRANIEKHLAACDIESDPNHGKVWRRLATHLADLAPMPVQMAGSHAVLFFIADGKYRMQVFALEDRRDGTIILYLPDILDEAVKRKLLHKTADGFESVRPRQVVHITHVDNSGGADPLPHVKQMLGWNRKALKLPITAFEFESPVIDAAEALCTLAASKFAKPAK